MAKFKTTSSAAKGHHDSLEPLRTHFQNGAVIFSEGDLGLAMYVVESGEVEIRKRMGDDDTVLALLGKGDFFGEMCMLQDEVPRSATAVAKTDVDAVMIDQAAFTFILERNPEIAVRMMRKLVRRLRQTTRLLEDAVGHKVDLESSGITEAPPAAADPTVRLIDSKRGVWFSLVDKKETSVGRSDPVTGIQPDIDLTPVDPERSVSRRHARFRRDEDGSFVIIEDVGTMNGTFINGERLAAGRPHPVASGDSVVFGTVECRFEIGEAKD